MENYNQFRKGTIVKITKNSPWDPKGEFTGFISEIISPPKNLGNCWNFTMLYGNHVRKEYSEMNFYHPSALTLASEHEIKVYKAMKCMANNLEDRAVRPLDSVKNYACLSDKYINVGQCLYNLYEDGIYVPAEIGYPNTIKIYDIANNMFATGIPEDNIYYFKKNLGYNPTKTINHVDLIKADWRNGAVFNIDHETEYIDMYKMSKDWKEKNAAAIKKGSEFHEKIWNSIEHNETVMNPILLL